MKKILLILGGIFITIQCGIAQNYEIDNSYITGTGFNGEINAMEFDNNGKLLVGGNFTDYDGNPVTGLARLNPDGTLDATYNPVLTAKVEDLTVHDDNIVTVVTAGALKRFLPDGTTDAAFSPPSLNAPIYCIDAEPTGLKVVIGGDFTDNTAKRIARLNADGSLDAAFETAAGGGFNKVVRAVKIANDGSVFIGGDFQIFNGSSKKYLVQLNADGTLNSTFSPVTFSNCYAIEIQNDDRILTGEGSFLRRYDTDGTVDFNVGAMYPFNDISSNGTDDIIAVGASGKYIYSFDYTSGVRSDLTTGSSIAGNYNEIEALAVQTDGAIIIGGSFSTYNGFSANNFTRIAPCSVSIDEEAKDTTICENFDASFTINASGTGSLTYQWQVSTDNGVSFTSITNGAPYSGVTTNELTVLAAPQSMNNYIYQCVVTDDNCSSSSIGKRLYVKLPTTFTTAVPNKSVCSGENTFFSVSMSGFNGGFQWQVDDNNGGGFVDVVNGGLYTGATTQSLSIANVPIAMDGYKYRLRNTSCGQDILSTEGTLTVNQAVDITKQPKDTNICVIGDVTFSVIESGGTNYQWKYFNGSVYVDLTDNAIYSGTNTPTLTITGADYSLPEKYTWGSGIIYARYICTISNNNCSQSTSVTNLKVYNAPTYTSQPTNKDLCDDDGTGVSTYFQITTDISGSVLTHQWQVDDGSGFVDITNGGIYSGSNTYRLNITNGTSALNDNLYRCIVGNCTTPVISDNARLNIYDKPVISNANNSQQTLCEGGDVNFTFTVTGDVTDIQWEEYNGSWYPINDNAMYSGTNSNSLDITGVTNTRNYRCVITNGSCSETITGFRINVRNTPSFSNQPINKEVCLNGSQNFSSSVSSFDYSINSYQWQKEILPGVFQDVTESSPYSGTQTNQLTVNPATLVMNNERYLLKILGCVTEVVSDTLVLTVHDSTKITGQPVSNITACEGEEVNFGITAEGAPPYPNDNEVRYQWQVINNANYSSYTKDSIKIN